MMNWYGFFFAVGFLAAYSIALFFLRKRRDVIGIDISSATLPLVVGGMVGARAMFVLYHLPYFMQYPAEIPAIWHGGWVWHGALIGGGLSLLMYARKKRISFLRLADMIVPGLALAQSIGRWGNYVNQEAYGLPTGLPWGIYIEPTNRLAGYEQFTYFHPTFLYESLWDLALFILLFILTFRWYRSDAIHVPSGIIFTVYLVGYSLGRFVIELLRIDIVPAFAGLRAPQWISLILIVAGMYLLTHQKFKDRSSA